MKNKHRKTESGAETTDEADVENSNRVSESEKQQLNLSYFQSLPANSLVVLDNDGTWREVYIGLLERRLSHAHVKSLQSNLNVKTIIYNMTKVRKKR